MSYMFRREHGIWYAVVSVVRIIRDIGSTHLTKPKYIWKILSLKTSNLQEAKERFANLIVQDKPFLSPPQLPTPTGES